MCTIYREWDVLQSGCIINSDWLKCKLAQKQKASLSVTTTETVLAHKAFIYYVALRSFPILALAPEHKYDIKIYNLIISRNVLYLLCVCPCCLLRCEPTIDACSTKLAVCALI